MTLNPEVRDPSFATRIAPDNLLSTASESRYVWTVVAADAALATGSVDD